MTRLVDEALAQIAASDGAWQSLRAEGTAWEDRLASRARRAPGRRPGSRPAPSADGSALGALGEREQHWRLWRAGQVLVRSEFELAHETVTVVGQGPHWWRWSQSLGSTSGNASSRPMQVMLGPPAVLLDAPALLEQLEIVDGGRALVAGRDAYLLIGRPLRSGGQSRGVLREAGLGADAYELRVDCERGVLLGVSAVADDRPFKTVQATLVGFDESFAPSMFAPPASQQGRFVREAPRQPSLAQLPATLGFPVLVPQGAPSPLDPHIAVLPAGRGAAGMRAVLTWSVADRSRRGQLRLQLTSEEPAPSARDRWVPDGDVTVCEDNHLGRLRRRVRTYRDGTFAELESSVLSLDELKDLARSLVSLGQA